MGGGGYKVKRHSGLTRMYGGVKRMSGENTDGLRFPTDMLYFQPQPRAGRVHPSQKPVELLEFLVKTYTNEGETVLDPFMGSGSCGVACINTGRKFIGFEKNSDFFETAQARIAESSLIGPQPKEVKPYRQ